MAEARWKSMGNCCRGKSGATETWRSLLSNLRTILCPPIPGDVNAAFKIPFGDAYRDLSGTLIVVVEFVYTPGDRSNQGFPRVQRRGGLLFHKLRSVHFGRLFAC